ncbi:MAG: triphosphoribosyl-dephospho-CoA synthase [Methylophilaceae bacterium]
MAKAFTPGQLSNVYQQVCLAEIEAIKPGNVHIFADGHGMDVQDFIKSATASANVITQPGLGLGERIYRSIEATWQAVNCNTNLGIVLLCAPIVQAALSSTAGNQRNQLEQVLSETTKTDAEWLFKAIRLANPAGLGNTGQHDVHAPVKGTLLEAMHASAERDFIGLQYSNGFQHVFEEGITQYQHALLNWGNVSWATSALYLYWLSHYQDSHIVRKYGLKTAGLVQQEALSHYTVFLGQKNPKLYFSPLLQFDASLKKRKINPGTSADLTVATLLLYACIK